MQCSFIHNKYPVCSQVESFDQKSKVDSFLNSPDDRYENVRFYNCAEVRIFYYYMGIALFGHDSVNLTRELPLSVSPSPAATTDSLAK